LCLFVCVYICIFLRKMEKDIKAAEQIICAKALPTQPFEDSSFTASMALPTHGSSVAFHRVKDPETKLGARRALCHWRPHPLGPSEYLVTGGLCHSTFVGVVGALLNANSQYLDVLFSISRPALGAHAIRFFRDYKWKLITVDDKLPFSLPVERGQLAFAQVRTLDTSVPEQETFFHVWLPLLEKAYSKMYGSYENIEVPSLVSEILYTLTGVPVITRSVSSYDSNLLWSDIQRRLLQCGMAVALRNEKTPDDCGIAVAVPYTILGAALVGESKERVIVMRPGLGCTTWKGAYSRGSPEFDALPAELRALTNVSTFAFAIPFSQLLQRFTEVYLMDMPVSSVHNSHSYTASSKWAGPTAGGSLSNQETWKNNPQFSLFCEKDCDITGVLSQLDSTADRFKYMSIGCVVAKSADNSTRKTNIYADELVASTGSFINKRDTVFTFRAKAGQSYIIVPSTYQPGKEGPFFLRICSNQPVEFRDISSEPFVSRKPPSRGPSPGRSPSPGPLDIPHPPIPPPASAPPPASDGIPPPPPPVDVEPEAPPPVPPTQPKVPPPAAPPTGGKSALKCSKCNKTISGKYFVMPTTKAAVCMECYEKGSTVCPTCKGLIPAGLPAHVYKGVRYHTACFHCQKCNHLFGNEEPTIVDGVLCCMRCVQTCASCGKVLGNGKVILVNGKQYHAECLICCTCKLPIPVDGEILFMDDEPICASCAEQLEQE